MLMGHKSENVQSFLLFSKYATPKLLHTAEKVEIKIRETQTFSQQK